MMDMNKLVRPNILRLQPYRSARDEYQGQAEVFLDANENPWGSLNRYPDPMQNALREAIAQIKNIGSNQLILGNGSDELIDMILKVFCQPAVDSVTICPPTYGMYEVVANIQGIDVVRVALDEAFQPRVDEILSTPSKVLFLCSPNNPTGNSLEHIETLVQQFDGIVVLDEAYADFSQKAPGISLLSRYPNLVVIQTLSKAWGLAGARIGMAFATPEIIRLLSSVKPPYNVSNPNQIAALSALKRLKRHETQKRTILNQRTWLIRQLNKISSIQRVFPSDSNFLLVQVDDANRLYDNLCQLGIITRNRHSVVRNCLRITVGKPAENKRLIQALQTIYP